MVDPLVDEAQFRQAVVEHVAAHSAEPDEICARTWAEVDVCAARHLVLTWVGDDKLLTEELMCTFNTCRKYWMALCRVAANDKNECGFFDIFDRAGVTS